MQNKIEFTPDELAIIQQHGTADRLNTFLYENPDCEEMNGKDRRIFVNIKNNCETQLTPSLHEKYHGKKCRVKGIDGEISIPLMITYGDNTTGKNSTRINSDGTIALWIITDVPGKTHLYKHTDIELI
jgi:hypothetical protein